MRLDDVTQILETVGAIRQGHFELTSGLHSGTYVQCALVLQYPKYAEQLGRALAAEFMDLDEHVLVIEDVWTTGGSTCETIRVLEEAGARVVAAGALIDRSGRKIELPVRTEALVELRIDSYDASDCPLCRSGGVAVKPGSRFARSGA